ncbi:MAG: AAA family ATPase [Tenacibaculum sp.]
MEKKLKQQAVNLIKVVLFGPESTGKTTLAKQLAQHYNTVWVPEYAREYLQKIRDNEHRVCQPKDLTPIAIGQMKLENKLGKKAKKVLICDTNLLQTKVYSEVYFKKYINTEINKAALNNFYHIYFLTYIDIPWEMDDLRDRPTQRKHMFNAFKRTLNKYDKPYVLLKGNKQTRFKKAIQTIDLLIFKKEQTHTII